MYLIRKHDTHGTITDFVMDDEGVDDAKKCNGIQTYCVAATLR
jgi:hypothetical protein